MSDLVKLRLIVATNQVAAAMSMVRRFSEVDMHSSALTNATRPFLSRIGKESSDGLRRDPARKPRATCLF